MLKRQEEYFVLNAKLSSLNTSDLVSLLNKGKLDKKGWGTNHIIKVGTRKVFAKKIPLTKVEFENSFSTKNHYNLPMAYNYGIGSAGFGAFRELLLHIKTTNWVLNNECLNFPLMYHYRIVKKSEKYKKVDRKQHNRYIKYWHGDKNISNYILERHRSKYEIVLFLEYIPKTFKTYLVDSKLNAVKIAKKALKTIDFLKGKGVIHLDMHFLNILTDGKSPFITDFGLGLDKSFELSKEEKSFFKRHANYDYGEFIGCMGLQLNSEFDSLSMKEKKVIAKLIGLSEEDSNLVKLDRLISNLNKLKKEGYFSLNHSYIQFLKKHKETIILTTEFFVEARNSESRDKLFSSSRLKKSLVNSGVI